MPRAGIRISVTLESRTPEQGTARTALRSSPSKPTKAMVPHLNHPRSHAGVVKKSMQRCLLTLDGAKRHLAPSPASASARRLPRVEMEARHCWLGFPHVWRRPISSDLLGDVGTDGLAPRPALNISCTMGRKKSIFIFFDYGRSLVFFFKLQN